MPFFLLLFGHVVLSLAVAGVKEKITLNLKCTNDLERMFCQLEEKNCLEYNLTLRSDSGFGTESCILQQCDIGKCCCDVKMTLIIGESHTASVQERDNILESKTIGVIESFKPKTPTIISVNETKNNVGVRWRTNMEMRTDIELTTQVMFYKKGGTEKLWNNIRQATVDGLQYYEISGEHLERSTAYVVRVRSVAGLSNIASDCSEEWEFKTSASNNDLLYTSAFVGSIAAVLISIAIYYCYVNLKENWWDKLPKPNISKLGPVSTKMLQPEKASPLPVQFMQPITDDDDQFSQVLNPNGVSESSPTDSDTPSIYAMVPFDDLQPGFAELMNHISQVAQQQASQFTVKDNGLFPPPSSNFDGSTSGSSDFDNASYALHLPSSSNGNSAGSPVVPLDLDRFLQMLSGSQSSDIPVSGYHPTQNPTVQPDVWTSKERNKDEEEDLVKYQEKPCSFQPFFQHNDSRGFGQHNFQAPFPFGNFPHSHMSESIVDEYKVL